MDGDYKVTPYFANIAATALTFNHHELGAVQDYISWYLTHLNWPDKYGLYGTVYDYYVTTSGTEISSGDYDSADSYAASFLSLVRAYYEAGGNVQFLRDHEYQLHVIADVMIKLLGTDDLTISKPNGTVQYLMDNCEVYRGLADVAFLFTRVFGDGKDGEWFQTYADKVRTAIFKDFGNGNEFYVYIDGTSKQSVDWNIWYPDTIAQLYPIVEGVISSSDSRAQNIYRNINRFHPGWVTLHTGSIYPWTIVGFTAALMGDTERAKAYYDTVTQEYVNHGSPWPWFSAEAGWFLRMNELLNSG